MTSTQDVELHDSIAMANLDGHQHVPINIHIPVRVQLRDFLNRPDVPRGMGYSAFISWALDVARRQLDVCESDGSIDCMVHVGGRFDHVPDEGYEDVDCDLRGMAALAPIDLTV